MEMNTVTREAVSGRRGVARWRVVILVAAGVVVAGGIYLASGRVMGVPVVRELVAAAGGQAADGTMVPAGDAPGPMTMDMPATDDPRAPVSLDLRRQQLIGVRTVAVERAPADVHIRAVGLVRYDETKLADVNLKVEGWIRSLFVDYTGKAVKQGDPLFTLYSPELLTTAQEYLLALQSRDRMAQSALSDARQYADRLVQTARQRIALWDLPEDEIQALERTRQAPTEVTFRSPAGGYVVEKRALAGLHVTPGETLFRIADLSTVWVEADVYERDVSMVKVGQRATVMLDAYPGETFQGRVIYVYPYVEEKARTVKVRFDLPNRSGRLKPGMYANVTLDAPMGMRATVPVNAVLDSGTRQLVFVSQGDGYFEPREVKVGHRLGERVEILGGLDPGDQVADAAAFFLDSESQLRASVQGFEATPSPASTGGAPALDITFQSAPDPPKAGDNQLEVSVHDADGQPVVDAEVSVTFFMAAMPSMSMPAMRTGATLSPAGNGLYRGTGQVTTPGRWDVTVDVMRNGARLGSRQLSVVAR